MPELLGLRAHLPDGPELGAYILGPVCISYSARPLVSSYFGEAGRDAFLVEETRPGQYMRVFEDGRGTYVFGAQGQSLLGEMDRLLESGIDSFEIEGRMETVEELSGAVCACRRAMEESRLWQGRL